MNILLYTDDTLSLYGSVISPNLLPHNDRASETFMYICLFNIPLFNSIETFKTKTIVVGNRSKSNVTSIIHQNSVNKVANQALNNMVGGNMVLTAVPAKRIHFLQFHPKNHVLFLISDVRGEVQVLEEEVSSNFSGPMYPPGFEVLERSYKPPLSLYVST